MRTLLVRLTCVVVLFVAVPWGSLTVYRHLQTRRIIDATLASGHWQARVHQFEQSPPGVGRVVFLGDSLTERFDLSIFGQGSVEGQPGTPREWLLTVKKAF